MSMMKFSFQIGSTNVYITTRSKSYTSYMEYKK
jgi:hypothetical protein